MSEQEHSDTPPSGRPNQRNLHSALSVAETQDDGSHSSVSMRETVEDQTSGEIAERQETTVDARENDEMLLQTLKKELKFHYNKLQRLQPMPWMKRVTVDLGKTFSSLRLMDSQSRRLLREEKALDAGLSTTVGRSLRSDIDVQQIFSPLEFDGSIIPKRILMEGEAGIGKTTLCRKLAYDWRNGEDYIKGFKAVFVIDIRKFKGSLKMALREQGLVSKDMGLDVLWEYIGRCADEFLWVIDGLDESYPDVKNEICRLIKSEIFRDSTVLATSRMYDHSFWGTSEDTFHREIRNTGFLPKTSDEFMEKYFLSKPSTFDSSDLLAFVRKDRGKLRNLTRNPLICMYLCFLWEDKLSRDALMMSQYLDFCQVSIKMRECVARRFYETNVKGKVPESVFEDRVQKARLLAFDGLMAGRQQYTADDINRVFSVSLAEDDIFYQMGLLSKELGKVDSETTAVFEFPHKTIQDELAGEYINLLTETERQHVYGQIISVPARHQMLVFMSALSRCDQTSKLMPMFSHFCNYLTTYPKYDSLLSNPFDDPTVCLPLECLSVSGCAHDFASRLSGAYQGRGINEIWFHEKRMLGSYEDNVKGLSCLVEQTDYREFITDVSVYEWNTSEVPANVLDIINRLVSLERVTFLDAPYKSISDILEANLSTIDVINQVRVLNAGVKENNLEHFWNIVTSLRISEIVHWEMSHVNKVKSKVWLRFTKAKECAVGPKHQTKVSSGRSVKTKPSKSRYAYETTGNAKDACFDLLGVENHCLNELCETLEGANLRGRDARIQFDDPSAINNLIGVLRMFQNLMSFVQLGLPRNLTNDAFRLARSEILGVLESEIIKSPIGHRCLNPLEYPNDYIEDVILVEHRGRCQWTIGKRTVAGRGWIVCDLCRIKET